MKSNRVREKVAAVFYLAMVITVISSFGHGTKYEILPEKTLGIKAMFDTGNPMAAAKVLIFAPDETKAASTATTDANGVFYFTPDKAGTWVMQVRDKGGHGMRINIEVNESMVLTSGQKLSNTMSYFQKILMALCVIWGCIGTALYFKKKVGT